MLIKKLFLLLFVGLVSVNAFSHEKDKALEEECLKKAQLCLKDTASDFDKIFVQIDMGIAYAYKDKKIPENLQKQINESVGNCILSLSKLMKNKANMEAILDPMKGMTTGMTIPELETRIISMCQIAIRFGQVGDYENAKKLIEETKTNIYLTEYSPNKLDQRAIDHMNNMILEAQSYVNPGQARKDAEEIQNSSAKIKALSIIGSVVAKKDIKKARTFFNAAKEIAAKLPEEIEKRKRYMTIASYQVNLDKEGAKEIFKSVRQDLGKFEKKDKLDLAIPLVMLGAPIDTQATSELITELIEISKSMKNSPEEEIIHYSIAIAYAKMGNVNESTNHLNKISDEYIQHELTSRISSILGRKDLKKAFDFISGLPNKELKSELLIRAVVDRYEK